VIASASDHYTRVVMNGGNLSGSKSVIGLLFGSIHHHQEPPSTSSSSTLTSSTIISINDATDVFLDANDHLSESEIEKKTKLWTTVYPSYSLIGWYAFDTTVTSKHTAIHKVFAQFFASPVFILFQIDANSGSSPSSSSSSAAAPAANDDQLDRIPLTAFVLESTNASSEQKSNSSSSPQAFIEKNYIIESTTVEKIALDEIIKSIPGEGMNKLEISNNSLITALTLLEKKIAKICSILTDMESGKIPMNYKLMTSASKIVNSLTALQSSSEFSHSFNEQMSSSMLSVYLSSLLKTYNNLNEVNELAVLIGSDPHKGNKAII
jgi:hypothetical protein